MFENCSFPISNQHHVLFWFFVFLAKKPCFSSGLSPLSSPTGICFRNDIGRSSCVLGSLHISHYSSNVWGLTKPRVHLATHVFPWFLNTCGFYGKFHPCVFDSFTLKSSKCCCVRSLWCPSNFGRSPPPSFFMGHFNPFFLETGCCMMPRRNEVPLQHSGVWWNT